MMTACRQCNKVILANTDHQIFVFILVIFIIIIIIIIIMKRRCGIARQPARGQMCGNTVRFAERISPSEGDLLFLIVRLL